MRRSPCYNFERGTCTRRDCKFSHDSKDIGSGAPPAAYRLPVGGYLPGPQRDLTSPPEKSPWGPVHGEAPPPCRFFSQGTCTRGMSCKFSHGTAPHPTRTSPRAVNNDACRDFQLGRCNRGHCKFSHDAAAVPSMPPSRFSPMRGRMSPTRFRTSPPRGRSPTHGPGLRRGEFGGRTDFGGRAEFGGRTDFGSRGRSPPRRF